MSTDTPLEGPRGTLRLIEGGRGRDPVIVELEQDDTQVAPVRLDLGVLSRRALEPGTDPGFGTGLPQPGERFKDWMILRQHARGGLSVIYEVQHIQSGLRYALKLLQPEPRTRPILLEKQLAEGKLLMYLRGNPYLCDVQDIGTTPEYGPYLVMDLLEGSSLSTLMLRAIAKSQRIELRKTIDLGIETAEALHMVHNVGVIHRDVKPDNIYLVPRTNPETGKQDMRVKLIDFGTARSHVSPRTSAEHATVATPRYAAPEIFLRMPLSGAVDQFSLAVVLYEMLWQHPLAESEQRGLGHLADPRHRFDQIEEPPAHLVPVGLWRVLRRALASRPADRFPSIGAFASELRAFLATEWRLAPLPAAQRTPLKPTVPASRVVPGMSFSGPRPTPAAPPTERRDPKSTVPTDALIERATLLVLAPAKLRGLRFELGADGVIGRHPAQADLVLEHESVSNRHLRYAYVTGGDAAPVYAIEDLESSNGSTVDGAPVYTGAIKPGELLGLGDLSACLVPAGKVSSDLSGFTPLDDVVADRSPRRARLRVPRREIRLADDWPGPSLLILEPAVLRGQRFDLGASGVIGRESEHADIALDETTLSARHASYNLVTSGVEPEDVIYLLEDLDSANGTAIVSLVRRDADAITSAPIQGGRQFLMGGVTAVIAPPGSIEERSGSFRFVTRAAQRTNVDASPRRVPFAVWIALIAAIVTATIGTVLVILHQFGKL